MSAGGFISSMVSSIKNNRRKSKTKPFSKYEAEYKKGKPIESKKISLEEKQKILVKLKRNRSKEDKIRMYKILVSILVTILAIGIIVFFTKRIFF